MRRFRLALTAVFARARPLPLPPGRQVREELRKEKEAMVKALTAAAARGRTVVALLTPLVAALCWAQLHLSYLPYLAPLATALGVPVPPAAEEALQRAAPLVKLLPYELRSSDPGPYRLIATLMLDGVLMARLLGKKPLPPGAAAAAAAAVKERADKDD